MRTTRRLILALGLCASHSAAGDDLTGYLLGQAEEDPAPAAAGPFDSTAFEFRVLGGYTAESDMDQGSVSVGRLDMVLGTQTRIGDRSALRLQFGAEHSFYDFTDAGPFSAGDEMDSGARYDLGAVFSSQIDERWSYFVGGSISAAPGEGASWGDSMIYGGTAGLAYQFTENLRVGLGLGVSSRLEDDVRFIPVPTLTWQIDERWRLETVDRALRIRGVELSYQANDWLRLFVLGGWASREFRLDDDGPSPDGVLRDQRLPVYLGATFTPLEHLELNVGVGGSAWSEFELLSSTGSEVAKFDADPAFGAWAGATIRF